MTWAIGAAALIYVALLLLLRVYEPSLIYYPGPQRRLTAPPVRLGLPIERVEIPTEDGFNLVGWVIRYDRIPPVCGY